MSESSYDHIIIKKATTICAIDLADTRTIHAILISLSPLLARSCIADLHVIYCGLLATCFLSLIVVVMAKDGGTWAASGTSSIVEDVIPDELLALILSWLLPCHPPAGVARAGTLAAGARALTQASRVCRRWYRVSSDPAIWSLLLEQYAELPEVAALVQHLSFPQALPEHHQHHQTHEHHHHQAMAYDRLAPKRIATTILSSKVNMRQSRSHQSTLSYHMFRITRLAARGAWLITGAESEVCLWELTPTRPRAKSAPPSHKDRKPRMRLRAAVNQRGRVLVVGTNSCGVAAFGYSARASPRLVWRAARRARSR